MRRKPIILKRKHVGRCRASPRRKVAASELPDQISSIMSFIDQNLKGIDSSITENLKKTFQGIDANLHATERLEDEIQEDLEPIIDGDAQAVQNDGADLLNDAMQMYMPENVRKNIVEIQSSITAMAQSLNQSIEQRNTFVNSLVTTENEELHQVAPNHTGLQDDDL